MTLGWLWTDPLPVENGPDVAATATIDGLGSVRDSPTRPAADHHRLP